MLESIWMTVSATAAGIAISIPLALGAARNIAPRPIYYACRSVVALSRTFQEVILAIFFVKLFGFGPFAGFITLLVATVGFYAKLLPEDIEVMDHAQEVAARATRPSWPQWLQHAYRPPVKPR